MKNLILFNKPFNVLSQFTSTDGAKPCLADYLTTPECNNFYPAGRLDFDSEGLLLLTNNGQLQHRIAHPNHKLSKTYWVQVEGVTEEQHLAQLRAGVQLKDGKTLPAKAQLFTPPSLWDRHPPIRQRQNIPTSWLSLTIQEGKNRQVRRMTAAVGLPTLRLIRWQIGNWTLADLAPGEFEFTSAHIPQLPISGAKAKRHLNKSRQR